MKYEIVCRDCGAINRNEVPIASKKDGLDLNCFNCETVLITFYHDDHVMGLAINSILEGLKLSKIVKHD